MIESRQNQQKSRKKKQLLFQHGRYYGVGKGTEILVYDDGTIKKGMEFPWSFLTFEVGKNKKLAEQIADANHKYRKTLQKLKYMGNFREITNDRSVERCVFEKLYFSECGMHYITKEELEKEKQNGRKAYRRKKRKAKYENQLIEICAEYYRLIEMAGFAEYAPTPLQKADCVDRETNGGGKKTEPQNHE